jgi:BACON domain-containing protein
VPTDVAVDSGGDVFVVASPPSISAVFTTPNAISTGSGAFRWLAELSASAGQLVYATYLPGLLPTTTGGATAVGPDGTVWVAGTAPGGIGLDSETDCGYAIGNPERTPAVVLGVDVKNSKIAQTISIGGSLGEWGSSLALDSQGNVYLGGSTCSPDFPGIDPSVFNPEYDNMAGFLVKLAAGSGMRLWTWSSMSPVWNVATDPAAGNAAVTGPRRLMGQAVPPPSPAATLSYINASGSLFWSTQGVVETQGIGGVLPQLTIDSRGRIYAIGYAGGTAGAWESGPPPAVPGVTPLVLTTIEPVGGELTTLPEPADVGPIIAAGGAPNVQVAATGGTVLPVGFMIATATPWLLFVNSPEPIAQIVTPLPNWLGSPPSNFGVEATTNTPGTYDGSFTITSPGFVNSPLTIPVHMVIPSPGGSAVPPEVVIYPSRNGGGLLGPYLFPSEASGYLEGNQAITSATSWISPILNGKDAVVDFSSLPSGISRGQVTVAFAGDPHSPYQVTVLVVIGDAGPASPNATPGALALLAQPDDSPKHGGVAVWPTLAMRQSFTAVSESAWLGVSPASGTLPQVLSITANPAGLQPGAYATHIDISANSTPNGGARIPVTFTIRDAVPFNVDPAAIAVSLPAGFKLTGGQAQNVTLTLSSSQPMTYQTGIAYLECEIAPQGGMTPGMLTLAFEPAFCGPALGVLSQDAGYLGFVTSGGDAMDVPVAIVMPGLFPFIEPGGVVNGATFAPGPVAPASIVSIFGMDLAPAVYIASSIPLDDSPPTGAPSMGYVGDAGFFYQSPNQWNIQIPTMPPGTYQLSIGSSPIVSFTVAAIAPYIFVWDGSRAIAQNQDYSLNQPSNPAAARVGHHGVPDRTGRGEPAGSGPVCGAATAAVQSDRHCDRDH